MLTLPTVWGFSLGGPIGNAGDAWQVPAIGYGLGGDIMAPKNIGEEYRRNLPVMYYAYDANFFGFFGLAGTTNVDAAYSLMNGVMCGQTNAILFFNSPTNGVLVTNDYRGYTGVPFTLSPTNNLDSYPPNLPDFDVQAIGYNSTAGAAGLVDLKSVALNALVEQMGLADPVRYAWTLHNRLQPQGTTCPNQTTYLVVQRNFDWFNTPLNQLQYSPYVNDTLYTYTILEFCSGTPTAVTVPINENPYASLDTPVSVFSADITGTFGIVAVGTNVQYQYQSVGGFFNNLTRDDVAGLRYLLTSNNINFEATAINGSLLLNTNVQPPQPFGPTLPFSLLFSSALTNDPNALQTNFPGITFLSVTTNIVNLVTTNITAFFTNLPPPYTNTLPFSNNATIYPTNGTVPFTNWSPVQYGPIELLTTLPLGPFLLQAQTNSPAQLQALYPGLLFGSVFTNFFFVQVVTNVQTFFTNLAGPFTNHVPLSNGVANFPTNGIVPFTNWSPVQYGPAFPLTTLPLGPLLALIPFTDPATLQLLYPGLLIDNVVTNYLVVQILTNFTPFFTNQSVSPVFTNSVKPGLTNGYYFTNQPGPTIINYDLNSFVTIRTLDLANFIDLAVTNDPATMQALYPGLQILQAHQIPGIVTITNYLSYLTNYTGAPFNGPPVAVTVPIATNYFFITNWSYIFGNVVTNHSYTNRTVAIQSIWTTNQIGAPFGSPFITNITTQVYSTNKISGDFFIVPTNWCGFQIIAILPPNNPPQSYGLTNTVVFNGFNTNGSTGTNIPTANTFSLTRKYYDIYTNYSYALRPGICEPVLAFATNTTTNVVNTYQYGFLNVVTNHFYTNTLFCVATTNVAAIPLGSPDLLVTNGTYVCFYTNLPSGDFFIVPPTWCGFQIISLLTNLVATNVVVSTNTIVAPNGSRFTQIVTSFYTNYTYSIRPGFCEPAVNSSATTTTNIVTGYQYNFANVVTNHIYYSNYVTSITTNFAAFTNALLGTLTNIITTNNYFTNVISGDFYIAPTNWCGFQILGLLTNNNITTNTLTATNLPGVVTLPGQQFVVTSYSAYTNYIYSVRPGVCEPGLQFFTNYTTNIVTQYAYVFGNIVTNHFATNCPVTVVTTNIAILTNGLVGQLTNIITTNVFNTDVCGDFFIVPPNFCVFTILSVLSSNAVFTTNTFTATNAPGTTNLGQVFSVTTVTSFSSSTFLVQASTCDLTPPVPALRQGVQRIQFIRANFDSLIGQFFNPITNFYSMVKVTNSQLVKEFYQRVVTRPDFLMSAVDLLPGPAANISDVFYRRNINFDQSTILAGLAGPGVIFPPTTITFNKSGRANINVSPSFLPQTNAAALWNWASFDGTTNDPVIYPNGTSIANLENQIFIHVSPATVPDGTHGVAYPPVVFTVSGGQGSFVWAAPNLSALVPGLTFNPATATLSGTPTTAGTFNFNLQVTDAVNRTVSLNYSIIIH